MKYPSRIAILIFAFGSFVGVALAYTTSITIDSIHGIDASGGHVALPSLALPATVYIEGTVTYDHPIGVKGVTLSATVNGVYIYGPEKPFTNMKNATIAEYSIPWYIEGPGFYTITVSAEGLNEDKATKKDNGCPAAPSIATHYLRDNSIDGQRDIIKVLAQETGKRGTLWAKNSCDEQYKDQTISFVVGELAE